MEKICPRVVSCADIISIATRDAVFLIQSFLLEIENSKKKLSKINGLLSC